MPKSQNRNVIAGLHLFALWALSCVPLTSSSALAQGSLQELIAAASKEGQLTLMSGPDTWGFENGVKALEAAFNKKYGLAVQVKFVPGPDMGRMASRILDEIRAGEKASTDVLSGGIDHMLRLIKAKALQPVEWSKYFPAMTGERVEFSGQIVSYYTQFYGVLYNTKRVPSQALPRRMNDLLNPKWRGTMATPPYAGVPARAIVGIKDLSIERMKKFFHSYMPLVGGFIRCGEEERIASGEFNLFFPACDILSAIISARRKGMPVSGIVLEDFAALEYKYWAIPKTSARPNLAKLWAAFALSPEGNRIYEQQTDNSSHLIEGSEAALFVREMTKKGIRFESLRATEQQDKLNEILEYRKELETALKR